MSLYHSFKRSSSSKSLCKHSCTRLLRTAPIPSPLRSGGEELIIHSTLCKSRSSELRQPEIRHAFVCERRTVLAWRPVAVRSGRLQDPERWRSCEAFPGICGRSTTGLERFGSDGIGFRVLGTGIGSLVTHVWTGRSGGLSCGDLWAQ